MKKLLAISLLLLFVLSTNMCFAKNEQLNEQISRLRNAKNAKVKVVNAKINVVTDDMNKMLADTKISGYEKEKRLTKYQKELEDLNNQKSEINRQYRKDKKVLKAKY